MTNENKLIQQLINGFREQKGKASCYAYKPLKPGLIAMAFIMLHRQKRTDTRILVVVNTYDERLKLKEVLDAENLSYNITILTKTYISLNYQYNYDLNVRKLAY